jgi:hypothetical protein
VIYATPEINGVRIVFQMHPDRSAIEIGEFNWENGRAVFYARSHAVFTQPLLESVLNFQRTIDPCIS